MINNYETIRSLLKFPTEHSFYFLEILKRRKENPEMERHVKLIKDYFIYSLEYFDKIEEEVKELCDTHNARAYFRLNVRDAKKIALQYNKRLAELFITEDYKNIPKSYASVVGEFHSDKDKTWVLDLDGEGDDLNHLITDVVRFIDQLTEDPDTVVARIPTKNGVHLITRPFRLDLFKNEFPAVETHRDNPTLLYMP